MQVRDEINKHSKEDHKPILLWLLSRYNMASKFSFVAKCHFEKDINYRFHSKRVWEPTPEGFILYSQREIIDSQI